MAKAKILCIEDSKTQGMMTKEFLEKSGYSVTWALDGMSAIRLTMAEPFDVILLDRILPDMDGNDLCRQLKHRQDIKGVPIIMVTSKNTTTDKVQGLESGADDYLPKPYDESELNARVYAALRTKRLQDELIQKNDEMKNMLARVEALSITDPLTGLFNRRRFEDILDSEFKKSKRYSIPLSCIMVDIDHFKSVNDTCGHAGGDIAIKETARIIKQSIRNVDTACRWGGEEFVVLTPMTTKAFAIQPARRIWKAVSDCVFTDLEGVKITVSIGIADMSGAAIETSDNLVQAADMALYQAKKNGRNRIEVHE
jgi:two-component system, cell cycle response regulator